MSILKFNQKIAGYEKRLNLFSCFVILLYFFMPAYAYGEDLNPIEANLVSVNEKVELSPIKLEGTVEQAQVPAPKLYEKGLNIEEDWLNCKQKLSEKGLNVKIMYVDDYFQSVSRGGSKKDSLKYNGFIKTNIELDTQKTGLWKGGKAHITFPNKFGAGLPSSSFESGISYSNVYTKNILYLGEFWYEHSLLDNALKIKVGKQDLENDYAVLDDSYNFINGGLSENPTILLPAISKTALGVSTTIAPNKYVKLRTGIFDGNAKRERYGFDTIFTGAYFKVAEGELNYNVKNHPGTTKIGFWHRSGNFDELTTSPLVNGYKANYGAYSAVRQMVYKENENPNDSQGLYTHFLYGWSPTDRNELPVFYGVGLQYKGLLAKRDKDIIAIGADYAKLNRRDESINKLGRESFIEAFYRMQVTKLLAIQPDVQVVFTPNGTGKTTWLLGLRVYIGL